MRKFTVLSLSAVSVILLLSMSTVHGTVNAAQATPYANCTPNKLITAISALKSTGDKRKDLQALDAIALAIENERIACDGMTFIGSGNKVLGPLTLPQGTYKVAVVTTEAFILDLRSLDETACDTQSEVLNKLNNDDAMDVDSQSVLVIKRDCKVVLLTSHSSFRWVLTFEPVQFERVQ